MAHVQARVHKDGTVEEIVSMPEEIERPESPVSMTASIRQQLHEDPELQGLSLYEKKAVLINRELDSHGMNRYQWWVWVLCGFGYFLDLLWAQAFGLALVAIIPEFGLQGSPEAVAKSGNLSTSFNAGLTAGAFVWGFLVDVIGRYWAFNGTCFVAAVFGLCLGAANDYNTLLVLVAFCGFGVGGNIPIDTTICLEFLPQNRRFLLAILSLFQPLGVIVSSALSYAFIPNHSCPNTATCTADNVGNCCDKASNYGWRYFFFCLGGISIVIFLLRFLVFNFRESPKYLLYRGHDRKAAKVLKQIAEFNHRQPMITLEHFEALSEDDASIASSNKGKGLVVGGGSKQEELTANQKLKLEFLRIGQLFATWPVATMTLLTWFAYMFDYLSFSAAGAFIPKILSVKGAQLEISTAETYKNYIIIYTPGIVAALLGGVVYVVPGVGRKWGMVGSSILQGVSLFLFATARTEAGFVGFSLLEYFMQTLFNAILYGWTPEIFPAPVRGTACGLSSFFGRIFGIVAPLISAQILATYSSDKDPAYGNGVLYFAGAAVWVSTLCILAMPNKRMGAQSF